MREKTTICAIIRKSHFAKNYPFPLLRNSSFAQFRNFVKLKRLVTVCVSKNSILDKSCFGMSSYNWSLLHNWPITVKKSSNLTIFSTILVLDMHISLKWILQALVTLLHYILYEIKKISEIWLKKIKNIIHTWLGKAFKGYLKLFNRIKILPSFTLSNLYFINFGPII